MNHDSKKTMAYNPATGECIGQVNHTLMQDLPQIFADARAAQVIWSQRSFKERKKHIMLMRNYIRDHAEKLAQTISLSNGKTLIDAASTEILTSILSCNWYADHAEKILKTETRKASSILWLGKKSQVIHEPLGVVGIISPWNYPFAIPFGEIVMGLMAGNAILLKVAANTPLVGEAIREIMQAGQLPQGLFHHIVGSGPDISTAFFEYGIDKIFFTGSVDAGKKLMAQAAATLTPLSLELGGKDPMIVLADADLERAANGAAWAGYQNAGQSCGGVERIYVDRRVYDEFMELLTEKTKKLRHGVATEQCDVDIGAMTTEKQARTVQQQVESALEQGARIVAQSHSKHSHIADELRFYPATLLTNVNHHMSIMRDETFGPVIPVMIFDTEQQAIQLSNDCSMALSASIWTKDLAKGKRLAQQIQSGVVVINDHLFSHGMADLPWGGPKESGIGRTHGPEGLLEMTRPKVVNWDYLRAKRNVWWYPQNQETYQLLISLMRIAAPKSIVELFVNMMQVIPKILKKMYSNW